MWALCVGKARMAASRDNAERFSRLDTCMQRMKESELYKDIARPYNMLQGHYETLQYATRMLQDVTVCYEAVVRTL